MEDESMRKHGKQRAEVILRSTDHELINRKVMRDVTLARMLVGPNTISSFLFHLFFFRSFIWPTVRNYPQTTRLHLLRASSHLSNMSFLFSYLQAGDDSVSFFLHHALTCGDFSLTSLHQTDSDVELWAPGSRSHRKPFKCRLVLGEILTF